MEREPEPNSFQRALSWMRRTAFEQALKRRDHDFNWPGPPVWCAKTPTGTLDFATQEEAMQRASLDPDSRWSMSKHIVTHIKPDTFQWLSRQHAKGMDVNVVSALQKAHGDSMNDALAWFERLPIPKTDSAFEMLRLGLANDRPDAAHAVAKYLDASKRLLSPCRARLQWPDS